MKSSKPLVSLSQTCLGLSVLGCCTFMIGCFSVPEPAAAPNQRAASLIDSGVKALRLGDLSMAEASFTSSFEIAPNARALDGLGCVAFVLNDLERAKAFFKRAIQLDSRYASGAHHYALVNDKLGDHDEARRAFLQAMKIDPSRAPLRNDYGAFLHDQASLTGDLTLRERAKRLWIQATALGDSRLSEINLKRLFEDREFGG